MFSNSSSFLGGTNSARPGQQQQQQQYGQQPPFQSTPSFQAQPTGYGGGPMQSQFTGYPGQAPNMPQQQLQNQYTGYPGQQAFNQQAPFPTGQSNPPPAPQQLPQATGMTSSQMADSFRSQSSQQSAPTPPTSTSKIPNIRLSFITAQDQAKFEQLFKSAAGTDQALSGPKARDLLMMSKLSGDMLSQIWYAYQPIGGNVLTF